MTINYIYISKKMRKESPKQKETKKVKKNIKQMSKFQLIIEDYKHSRTPCKKKFD